MAHEEPLEGTALLPVPTQVNRDDQPIAQITSEHFAGGEYADEIRRQYINNCHYDWATSRLVWDGDLLVHHWGVWGYPMRLGAARLQVAGVGAVVTREKYRRQGLMTLAALDSLQAMKEQGYDLSILRGRHYARFGYVRAWNYVTYRLKADEIPDLEPRWPYEMLGPEEMDSIAALYNESHTGFSGTAVRPTFRMLEPEGFRAYGWTDESGKLAGYVRAVPKEGEPALQCFEATGDPEQGLAVLTELFRKGEYEVLTFFTLPYHHPILGLLRRGACTVEDRYFRETGWLVRLVNLKSTLGKLRPLLEERLVRSWLAGWRGRLHLDAGDEWATLEIKDGRIKVVDSPAHGHEILGGPALARLLIGSDDPGEVIRQERIPCWGKAAELAEVLFPNLRPVMSHWDEY